MVRGDSVVALKVFNQVSEVVEEADGNDYAIAPKADFKGDFRNGFIDFGWDKQSDEWKARKRAIELNQGRAAQMGILALMVHEKLGVSLIPSL